MTYKEFTELGYPGHLPMEYVLAKALYEGKISFTTVVGAHNAALEKERHIRKMRFEEACINLTQLLNGLWKGKELKEAQQRALHTLNMSETLPNNIYNKQYDYTDEVKEKWDGFCEMMYGNKLDDVNFFKDKENG